jgi:hypothetical protein
MHAWAAFGHRKPVGLLNRFPRNDRTDLQQFRHAAKRILVIRLPDGRYTIFAPRQKKITGKVKIPGTSSD